MRIISGVQPSGRLHLGNYFGAMKQHLDLMDQGEMYLFIADYHALTTIKATAKHLNKPSNDLLRQFTIDVALDYLALGLNPEKVIFFRQSDVPEVCELSWILSTTTNKGLLDRAVSYKEKVQNGIDPLVGLFTYPVLMAADILLYRSQVVPVGFDQLPHIEIAQDIAGKFNRAYGKLFPIPIPRVSEPGKKVIGIDGRKMSKSYDNTIGIFDEEETLRKKIMSIKTDGTSKHSPKDYEKCNVFALYKLFATEQEVAAVKSYYKFGGFGYSDMKNMLLDKVIKEFAQARTRREFIKQNDVETILQEGAKKARQEAKMTIDMARTLIFGR